MFKRLILFAVISAVILQIKPAVADEPLKVASKQYVDSIVTFLSGQSDWEQADTNSRTYIKNKPDLSDMATQSWVEEQGYWVNTGAGFVILSAEKTNAATNDEFWIDLDGFRWRAFKTSTVNYWGLRIVNNKGVPIEYGSRGMQQYNGVQMNAKGGILASGAEVNPDTDVSNVGYSKEDVFITHFFDVTNMHLYRWTVHVYADNAVMVLERLH
ncbi:MAG: hypothetical protein FWE50_01965 [Alphaproteobacteria bacterium]|nr:hypothetical protein [Alphaproteobacteria bacterium]